VGMQPIDLQTLYSQMEKVGKAQGQQQAAVQNARDAELVKNREEAEKRVKTVQETDAGEEVAGIRRGHQDKAGEALQDGTEQQDENNETETTETHSQEIIRDPDLGSKIDISG